MGSNQEQTEVINKVKIPKKYKVIMLNDDFTSFEFVQFVLVNVYHKTAQQAKGLANQIHQSGQAIAGVYCLEIAEMKVLQTSELAKVNGYPLKCILEKE